MGKGKPRHADRHKIPPPHSVPQDWPCGCTCHGGAEIFEFFPCCSQCYRTRADWPEEADRSVLGEPRRHRTVTRDWPCKCVCHAGKTIGEIQPCCEKLGVQYEDL